MNDGPPTAAAVMSLPVGSRLGEFELLGIVGEGGFSIVYLAYDHSLQRTVAIKEYLPGAIAFRDGGGIVRPRFDKYDATFNTGLQSFLNEARILAQFEHPALIRIHRFWEQNGTAYMVMQYCKGRTLRKVLQDEPDLCTQEQWIKQRVIVPVLDALRLLHAQNYYHRDLSPDNIMVLDTGAPMLLDFGAARQVIGDMTQALTVILKPGFAPIEQYADDESMRQGPWTDIYGVGAVLYFVVTGKAPVASVARLVKDPLKKLHRMDDCAVSANFAQAIDHALAVFPNQRPQSIDDFEAALNPAPVAAVAMADEREVLLPTQGTTSTAVEQEAAPTDEEAVHVVATASRREAADVATDETVLPHPVPEAKTELQSLEIHPDQRIQSSRASIRAVRRWPLICAGVLGLLAFGTLVSWWTGKEERGPITYADSAHLQRNVEQAAQKAPHDSAPSAEVNADGAAPSQAALGVGTANQNAKDTVREAAVSAQTAAKPVDNLNLVAEDARQATKKTADSNQLASSVELPTNVPKGTSAPLAVAEVPTAHRTADTPNGKNAVVQLLNETSAGREKSAPTHAAAELDKRAAAETRQDKPGAYVRLSIRPWGRVVVDGQDKGISPPVVRIWLAEGDHHISIENGDLQKFSESIKIFDKKDITISHQF